MTVDEFNELAEKAIEECFWRNTEFGTPICKGNLAPCQVEIKRGRCDALRTLVQDLRKEGELE